MSTLIAAGITSDELKAALLDAFDTEFLFGELIRTVRNVSAAAPTKRLDNISRLDRLTHTIP